MTIKEITMILTEFDNKVLRLTPVTDNCSDHGITANMLLCEFDQESWIRTKHISASLYKLKRHGLINTYIGTKDNRQVRKFEKTACEAEGIFK